MAKIFLYIVFPMKGMVATPTRDVMLMMVTETKPYPQTNDRTTITTTTN